ncbi:MAG TPA: hypothetical protein VHJ20_21405 [Polyangia bacterium]|nr:hypothetical protein [Polyangia bacterium]
MAQRRPARGRKRAPESERDVALVFGKSDEGDLHVLRRRASTGAVEAGLVRPLREGRAITGEVVSLAPREDSPLLFDVETDRELSANLGAGDGPPQVATKEYRRGWDAIWGARARSTDVN